MLREFTKEIWERALEKDSKLKDLAVKAGIENDWQRAKELDGCFAFNCGTDVVKSKEEQDIALYLFCHDIFDEDEDSINSALRGRILVAKAAGISINDL